MDTSLVNLSPDQSNEPQRSDVSADILAAHKHSSHNKNEIKESKLCGCFFCLRIFEPNKITQWGYVVLPKDFAVCPYCEIDSVIGDASGYPVTKQFLKAMHEYWFKT